MDKVKCSQIEKCPDCFARNDIGECLVLSNTTFEKKCPFYKLKKDQLEAIEKYKIKFREQSKCKKN